MEQASRDQLIGPMERLEREKLLTGVNSYGSQDGVHTVPSRPCLSSQEQEEELRRKLKYFFMSPCDKYRAKGRKPYKLLVQIFKLMAVTAQLILFGLSNQMVVDFTEENTMTFKHLFLKDYVDGSECVNVSPTSHINPRETLKYQNITLKFYKLINVSIMFKLKAINIQTIINHEIPDCYTFQILVSAILLLVL
ncbi:hypothetical protein scyTo_0019630 [Scyliorhinus torazame]|uniref:Mucolipin extracytosolic domain-containing protein n=1 Tax=Scyliorhinus torazame TaxID=75743 RepID=A0A401Q3I3_SCYTO|nr:hypothetical protein [Scyliorhinus torazame]